MNNTEYNLPLFPEKLTVHLQILNMLCCWVEDPNSEAFKLHLPRIHDYMWVAEDGMKIKVYKYQFPVLMFEIWVS